MKRIPLFFLFLGVVGNLSAQTKTLTLSESVLQQFRAFAPDSYQSVSWVPGTDTYAYMSANGQALVRTNVKKASVDSLTIQDVNKVLTAQMSSFWGYSWKNAEELYLNDGSKYYVYNTTTKKGSQLMMAPEKSENQVFHEASGNLAYTNANDLYMIMASGEKRVVASNENPNIVSGQAIARSEFGITGGIFWSPKGKSLAFYQKDETNVKTYPLEDITKLPAELKEIKYPMTGQGSEKPKVGIYSIANSNTVFISPESGEDSYLTNLAWTPDEKYIIIAEVNRDQNHMWLNLYDAATGKKVRTLLEEQDTKWVEPEHPAFFPSSTSNNFVWISEGDGFNNLYYYDIEGKLIKKLTSNKFVTKNILTAIKGGKEIVFAATGTSPLNTLYYAVDLNGAQRCLTLEEGTHAIFINSTGTHFIDQYSSHSVVGKTELKTINGKIVKTLVVSKNKLADYMLGKAEITPITGKDGSILYTRMIKPSNFDPNKKYPVLVYVYGGPHAQMITNSWLDGANLWMYWMAEQGYIVFTLDNRGSGERGKAFEQQIHRQLGTVEMEDQMTGVEYLKSLPYVDGNRLAVHGWSFGGFMTTSLMLRQSGTFNVGVAGGPVTDWKYYEVMYGERYMDRPEENAKGYETASLFTHAGNLKGDLLLIHGTVDDVVVPQNNYALVKKFIDLGIQMDFFPYPMHPHNVRGKDRVHLMQKVLEYVIENNE